MVCALAWGARGREFKSHRPDHSINIENIGDCEGVANLNEGDAERSPKHSPNISGALEADRAEMIRSAREDLERNGMRPTPAEVARHVQAVHGETVTASEVADCEQQVKFPKRLRHRGKGKVLATIYKQSGIYRLYWRARVDGKPKSRMRDFKTYAEAKREGDKVIADLAMGRTSALSPGQAADALNALEELQRFYQATGRRISIRSAVGAYCEALRKLKEHTLEAGVEGFLTTVATVKRKDLAEAVEQFVESRKFKTVAKDGKRPQLSPGWHYIIGMWLREFAKTFPGHSVSDLTKEHLTKYLNGHGEVSARTRNGRRNAVKMLLKWCVERDYLNANHRLLVADGMAKEVEDFGDVEFHTAKELRAMLECSQRKKFRSLLPVIALGGLAGLRLQEVARLTWPDVWRVPGHIEVTAGKAKTRQRRLVKICPALTAWLRPFRTHTTGKLCTLHEITFQQHFVELCNNTEVTRKANGLRHAFCTYHFASNANENLTAQQAGNSPAQIHAHYKGLATKKEAKKWFNVRPARTATNVIPLRKVRP